MDAYLFTHLLETSVRNESDEESGGRVTHSTVVVCEKVRLHPIG